MAGYESIVILDPNTTEEDQKSLLEKMTQAVAGKGGSVLHRTLWGRRKLAYPVKKLDYGIYHVLYLDENPEALTAMETFMRYEDGVLKWQTVSVEDVEVEFAKFEKLKTEGSVAQNLSDR